MWLESLTEDKIHIVDAAADKWELIENLRQALVAREKLEPELAAEIQKELLERERLMSTGIGEQMAIPHAVISGACRFMTECAIVRNGIDFDSIDGSRAYIVVMLVAPKAQLQEHLKVMASIAKVFYNGEIRRRVIAAETPAAVLAVLQGAKS